MTTTELFRKNDNQRTNEMMQDCKLEASITRVEKFNIWMEKINNKYRGEFKQMCHARAIVAAHNTIKK